MTNQRKKLKSERREKEKEKKKRKEKAGGTLSGQINKALTSDLYRGNKKK